MVYSCFALETGLVVLRIIPPDAKRGLTMLLGQRDKRPCGTSQLVVKMKEEGRKRERKAERKMVYSYLKNKNNRKTKCNNYCRLEMHLSFNSMLNTESKIEMTQF